MNRSGIHEIKIKKKKKKKTRTHRYSVTYNAVRGCLKNTTHRPKTTRNYTKLLRAV